MRVNIYAEEITDRVEIFEKRSGDQSFTAIRFYLELPVTMPSVDGTVAQVSGPFRHHPDDDDSSAVTFWGKKDMREVLQKAIAMLDAHHLNKSDDIYVVADRRMSRHIVGVDGKVIKDNLALRDITDPTHSSTITDPTCTHNHTIIDPAHSIIGGR
jgi:hypothetical protein